MKNYNFSRHEATKDFVKNRRNEILTTITLHRLKQSLNRRIKTIESIPKCYPYINESLSLLYELQKDVDNLPFRRSIFDEQVTFVVANKEYEKSLIKKSMPTKYDYEPSTISISDVNMYKEDLQTHIKYITKVKKTCIENNFKKPLVELIDNRIIFLQKQIQDWDNIKTYDVYSHDTDLQLIERTQQIYKENKKFKNFVRESFDYGILNHPRPKSFMSLMNIMAQTDKKILDDLTNNNTEPITNIIQSMVIIEKHAKQGGSKDQLARAMFNLYNTHIFDEREIDEIISRYISDEANFNIRQLASYELFKNPPEWLQKLIDGDKKIMSEKIIIKEESSLKKKILDEKNKIKKQFLRLTFGKKHRMNDECQNEVFEKQFNAYLDGRYNRLDKDINLQEIEKLLNMVKLL